MRTLIVGCAALTLISLGACDNATVTAQWDSGSLKQDESPAGLYVGTLTNTSGALPQVEPVTAIIDADGNAQLVFSRISARHVAGRVDVSGDVVTGVLTEYSGAVTGFLGTGGIGVFTIEGTVSSGTSIVGEYTAERDAGRFALDYLAAYDDPSSLTFTEGVWSRSVVAAGGVAYTVTWEIDSNGLIFGADTLGCVFVGEIAVVDETVNAYSLAVQVGSCGNLNGDYSGQAFLSSGLGLDLRRLTLGMANDVLAYSVDLQKEAIP